MGIGEAIFLLVGVGAVVGIVFTVVWLRDARRSDEIEGDPERVDTDNEAGPQAGMTVDDPAVPGVMPRTEGGTDAAR